MLEVGYGPFITSKIGILFSLIEERNEIAASQIWLREMEDD